MIENIDNMASNYIASQKEYTKQREEQKFLIVEYLNNEGFSAKKNVGNGSVNYNSQGDLKKKYDLRTYKCVVATKVLNNKEELEVFISLQPPEQDSETKNRHTLIDRIGLRVYPKYILKEGELKRPLSVRIEEAKKDFYEIELTEIDLPLTRVKLTELLEVINTEIEKIS